MPKLGAFAYLSERMMSLVIRPCKLDFQVLSWPSTATAMHCFMLLTNGVLPNTDFSPTADDNDLLLRIPCKNCDHTY